jgi:hypothetical protein
MNTLEMLWQPPSGGQTLELHLEEEAEVEEEEEGEEAVAEGNRPLSLLNSSSPFPQQPTYSMQHGNSPLNLRRRKRQGGRLYE